MAGNFREPDAATEGHRRDRVGVSGRLRAAAEVAPNDVTKRAAPYADPSEVTPADIRHLSGIRTNPQGTAGSTRPP